MTAIYSPLRPAVILQTLFSDLNCQDWSLSFSNYRDLNVSKRVLTRKDAANPIRTLPLNNGSVEKRKTAQICLISHFFSGLVAGNVWGTIWPEHRGRMLATSSIFAASIKVTKLFMILHVFLCCFQVFGRDCEARAVPVKWRGKVYFNSESDPSVKIKLKI